ncbi:MAG: hypothetical protein CME62_12890 [Halobacteriovoraceae bacterium]|nr:hypothetical protein [Halobacteriovoraceae bacterium]
MERKALFVNNFTEKLSNSFPFELALNNYDKVFAFNANNLPEGLILFPREVLIKNIALGNPWIRDHNFCFAGKNFQKTDEHGHPYFLNTYLKESNNIKFENIPFQIQGGQALETKRHLFLSESILTRNKKFRANEIIDFFKNRTEKDVIFVPEMKSIFWSYHLDLLCCNFENLIFIADPFLIPNQLDLSSKTAMQQDLSFYKNFFNNHGYEIHSLPLLLKNEKDKPNFITFANSLIIDQNMILAVPEGLADDHFGGEAIWQANQTAEENNLKIKLCPLPNQLLGKNGFMHCLSSELNI